MVQLIQIFMFVDLVTFNFQSIKMCNPIEVIFGKDTASIIYRYAWMSSINIVNNEYLNTYRYTARGLYNTMHRFYFNVRDLLLQSKTYFHIYNFQRNIKVELPKNYCKKQGALLIFLKKYL